MSARVGKVLGYTPGTVDAAPVLLVDLGGGDHVDVEWYGDDSPPVLGAMVALVPFTRSGEMIAVAATNAEITESPQGEKRVHGRAPDGTVTATLRLGGDGSIALSNSAGSFAIGADGTVTINGVTIDAAGNLVAASVAGTLADLDTHTHTAPAGGGKTTPPDPAP